MAEKLPPRDIAKKRLARLKQGYPLSTGKILREDKKGLPVLKKKKRPTVDLGEDIGKRLQDRIDQKELLEKEEKEQGKQGRPKTSRADREADERGQ